ncbi:hypothetical protein F5X68DRAFT_229078 [Plectosphaerella plurivora]|uniref:Uncharacterized protein n=1 Tax=Plectosphaerella plurivora TaxID=936078 RepID=A0A9P9ABH7_9PEZI|nr:hypothetical protein F5X68DRAFT_229078 [Plectosphaerella plurivora]
MKVAYFLLSALATVAIAAPTTPTGDEIMVENLEKRQICGGACENGRKYCYNCSFGSCQSCSTKEGVEESTMDIDTPGSRKIEILHRRVQENLPLFGQMVEHADQYTLRYHEREDARNIELFLDLFFVAIFSTFTKNHEINSNESLSSYAVYFGVIWGSWLQACLFDVRFGFDSMFERFTKAVQMCMFIGFASSTGCLNMDPVYQAKTKGQLSGFGALNVLMIVSRALYALQYFVVFWLVGSKHRAAKLPLLMTSGMYLLASIIYVMMFKFLLLDAGKVQGFYGYYALLAFELAVLSWVAARYECISFKNTHLHKRLMVLTLMILGEGVIVCAFSFAKISSKTGWTPNSFGQALCVVLSIYFIYCLYFGNSGIERARQFNPTKQGIYAILHLPFHLSLALTLEGLRTWTIIANVQYNFKKVYGYIDQVIGNSPDIFRLGEIAPDKGSKIVDTLNKTVKTFGFDDSSSWKNMQAALVKLNLAWQDDPATLAAGIPIGGATNKDGILKFYFDEFTSLFQNEQFKSNSLIVPDVQVQAANGSGVAQMDAYFAIFKMIFIYFFICTAIVMIILSFFRSMSIGERDKVDRTLIGVRLVMGIFLGLLGLMGLMDAKVQSYISSGVLLPTFLFVLILVVGVEKALTIFAINRARRSGLDLHIESPSEKLATYDHDKSVSGETLSLYKKDEEAS